MKKLYIWWEWLETWKTIKVIQSYNWELLDEVSIATEKEVDLAIKKAEISLKETRKLEPVDRANILKYIAKNLTERHEEFSQMLSRENWKTIKESRLEMTRCVNCFEIAIWEAERIYWEAHNLWITEGSKWRFWIVKLFPIWVVVWIAPFNFPMNLMAHKVAPAIASGCPIIIKPASATPITTLMLAEIIEKSWLPKWAFSVLPCDRKIWQLLVEDKRPKLLSFTWSPFVWWKMKNDAWKKKVILELGWNAGLIIDKWTEITEDLISRVAFWAFYQAGQTCISVQRIFIHKNIYENFKEKFVKYTSKIKLWNPLDENTDIWPLIDEKNKDRILNWIKEAWEKWAKILSWNTSKWNFVHPTILENTPWNAQAVFEEVFWPIVNIENFWEIDEVIEKINSSKFWLQVWIYSNNLDNVMKTFEEIEAWWIIHNDVPSFRVDNMPYGWVKDSGLWREWIKYAIKDMMEEKLLVLKKC